MNADLTSAANPPADETSRRVVLRSLLAGLDSLAVAFSGGVDSTVLAHAAVTALGDRAVAVLADSPSLPRAELAEARRTAAQVGIRLVVVQTDELSDEGYQRNTGDRCYFCKAALFRAMEAWCAREGITHLALGEIADDALDHRPGRVAAQESGVLAPLALAGYTKEDVRSYAREYGLEVAEKPASACLASRIPVGTRVDRGLLAQVEQAEAGLKALGARILRVRHHGTHARVELGAAELELSQTHAASFDEVLTDAGFSTWDTARYRSPAERALSQD